MFTQPLIHRFRYAKLLNLVVTTSDHASFLLDLNLNAPIVHNRRFHFENAWLKESDYKGVVDDA